MIESASANTLEKVYRNIDGGPELLDWFGRVPSFHDAEILSLSLDRKGQSSLRIHAWNTTQNVGDDGYLVLEKHALVTFHIDEIIDLQLDGFSKQNVIGGLEIAFGPPNPERKAYYAQDVKTAYELSLEPCYGMDGTICCKNISVRFKPGRPTD